MPASRRRRAAALGLVAVVALAAVLAGVYVTLRPQGNGETADCTAAAARAAALQPLATGEVAALTLHKTPGPAAALTFIDGDGAERALGQWRGRTTLVNLWATWCVPCKREMPALDGLQAALGGDAFEVVAINVDLGGPDKGKDFYREVGLKSLAYYHDPKGDIFRRVRALGLPTTLLVDRDGCEIGRMAGPAEWDSDDAHRLVRAATGPSSLAK